MLQFFRTLILGIKDSSFLKVWLSKHYQTKQLQMILDAKIEHAELSDNSIKF